MSTNEDAVEVSEPTDAPNEAYEAFIEQFITPEEEEMNKERVVLMGAVSDRLADLIGILSIWCPMTHSSLRQGRTSLCESFYGNPDRGTPPQRLEL